MFLDLNWYFMSWDGSVRRSVGTRKWSEELGFDSRQKNEIFIFFIVCTLALGPTQSLSPAGKVAKA
jgi:hypothetical protein